MGHFSVDFFAAFVSYTRVRPGGRVPPAGTGKFSALFGAVPAYTAADTSPSFEKGPVNMAAKKPGPKRPRPRARVPKPPRIKQPKVAAKPAPKAAASKKRAEAGHSE